MYAKTHNLCKLQWKQFDQFTLTIIQLWSKIYFLINTITTSITVIFSKVALLRSLNIFFCIINLELKTKHDKQNDVISKLLTVKRLMTNETIYIFYLTFYPRNIITPLYRKSQLPYCQPRSRFVLPREATYTELDIGKLKKGILHNNLV